MSATLYVCPACGNQVTIDDIHRGIAVDCPHCGQRFTTDPLPPAYQLPKAQPVVAPPPAMPAPNLPTKGKGKRSALEILGWTIAGAWVLLFTVLPIEMLNYFGLAVGLSGFFILYGKYQDNVKAQTVATEGMKGSLGCVALCAMVAFYLFVAGGVIWMAVKFFRWVTGL